MRKYAGGPFRRVAQHGSAAVDGDYAAERHAGAVNLAAETYLTCSFAYISGGLARRSSSCVAFAGDSD